MLPFKLISAGVDKFDKIDSAAHRMQIVLIYKDYLHKYFVESGPCFLWLYKIKGLMGRPRPFESTPGDLRTSKRKAYVDLAVHHILFII